MIKKFPAGIFIFAAFSAAVFYFTLKSGRTGLYMFDTGISTHMGWLIYNGWRPYLDFTMPLTPLSGLMSALGYKLFGVTYLSGAYISGLASAAGFFVSCLALNALLPCGLNVLFSLALTAGTLPVIGVPYYNHVTMLLNAVTLALMIRYLFLPRHPLRWSGALASAIYLLAGVSVLCKFHIGVMLFGIFFLIDAVSIREQGIAGPGGALKAAAIRFLPVLLLFALFLGWIDYDLPRLIDNLFRTATIDLRTGYSPTLFDEAIFVLSQPMLSVHFFLLLWAGYLLYLHREKKLSFGKNIGRSILLFLPLIILMQVLINFTTKEPNFNLYFDMILLLLLFLHSREFLDEKVRRPLLYLLVVPLLLFQTVFCARYALAGGRKSWDERFFWHTSLDSPPLDSYSDMPYFKGVRMRALQKANLDVIYRLDHFTKGKKIFLGPGLEMLYAATGRMPPKNWPLWMHPNTSFRNEDAGELRTKFAEEKYDFLIFKARRNYLSWFLDPAQVPRLARNYRLVAGPGNDPNLFLEIYERRK